MRSAGVARLDGSGRALAVAAPGVVLPRTRPRPAGPSRGRSAPKRARRAAQGSPGIALRAVGVLEGISASTALDRLIRGRAWIGLLAFALIGIVTMQLLVLQLNTGIGHTLARAATLQRENAQLGIEESTSSAESRVAPLAAAAGMTLAPPGTVHFVAASTADVSRAASVLSSASHVRAGGLAGTTGAEGGSSPSGSSGSAVEAAGSGERVASAMGERAATAGEGVASAAGERVASAVGERAASTTGEGGGGTGATSSSSSSSGPGG